MLEKFSNNNKAENIRRWLETVDLQSADILQVERDIYAALVKGSRKSYWPAPPIAPYAEPVDLNDLVGDLFNDANQELSFQASRVDNFYTWLSETNNVLKSEIETVEKALIQATDDIQDINIVIGDENKNFYWVSDSFNNNSFVDPNNSTCLVDTDYGMVTLGPSDLQSVLDYSIILDREVTQGIPGCNLYVINLGKKGLEDKEPDPILEKTDTRNFGAVFDVDPSTWFEIERNFIPEIQKVKLQGRAFNYTESGEEKNVREITKDYDWKTVVEWPDGWLDAGEDGTGRSLAEWRNINTESPVATNAVNTLGPTSNNPDVKLAFDIILKQPTNFSAIKMLPFLREDGNPIRVDSIEVETDGNNISVIKDIELGTNKSTTKLQREILRRTGIQLVGSVFSIPTDRDISKIRIVLSSSPSLVKNGFAHIFQDVHTEFRTERNHGLWRTADQWKEWGRHPFNKDVPKITSSSSRPGLVGTLLDTAGAVYSLGRIFNGIQQDRNVNALNQVQNQTANSSPLGALGAATGALNAAKIGGTLGTVGSWLGQAVPVVGAILALDQLVGGFFAVDKSTNVLEARRGYDIFKGHRAAIGLRDITLVKTTYQNESIIQSVKREFPGNVSKIGLFVDENIPKHWGPGDWITYSVSIDGVNWKSIPKLTDSTLEKSLVLDTPSKTVYFKAIIKGNEGDIYHSPQLRHYSLQGLPS